MSEPEQNEKPAAPPPRIALRPAVEADCQFAFEAKRHALGPHIMVRWAWDEAWQLALHRRRWLERPWSIIEAAGVPIGTLSLAEKSDHIQFGEFYLLPAFQGQGVGGRLLGEVTAHADGARLPIHLEYLKWNPVGSLYRRHGFERVGENDIHYFMVRRTSEI